MFEEEEICYDLAKSFCDLAMCLQHMIDAMNVLPQNIIEDPQDGNCESFRSYLKHVTEFAQANQERARAFIEDIKPGVLHHHDIHAISVTESFEALIGLSLQEFGCLFDSMVPALKIAFPNSILILKPGETHYFASIRMKLFLFLFRLKNGCSFRFMEGIFGWNHAALQSQYDTITQLLYIRMYNFHEGLLDYLGPHFQQREMNAWKVFHINERTRQLYVGRIIEQNNAHHAKKRAGEDRDEDLVDADEFVGSIGAVDGTYSVRPAIMASTLAKGGEDPGHDRMYSEYIKMHAHKLLLLVSHGFTYNSKLILKIWIGPGSVSDIHLYDHMHRFLSENGLLVNGAAFLGDHAFRGAKLVITPYTEFERISSDFPSVLSGFNVNHSSDRMCSEHGVKFIKYWGAIRGRTDIRLFEDEKVFKRSVYVAQALHNYKALGCPCF